MSDSIDPTDVTSGPDTRPPTLNSMQLRRIAEWASGYRGQKFWMVARHSSKHPGHVRIEKHDQDPGPLPDAIVIPCDTPDVAIRPPLEAASIQAKDNPNPLDLLNLPDPRKKNHTPHEPLAADAVFWSQSAVEKFVVPYYASVAGEKAGRFITKLLNTFDGIPGTSAAEPGAPRGTTGVYGMVHIPKSEYIELSSEALMEDVDLGFIVDDPATGGLGVIGIAEMQARMEGRPGPAGGDPA